MPPSEDLARRIARLEELLETLERSRTGSPAPVARGVTDATDCLRQLATLLDGRSREPFVDDGDAIAMRALLEEFRSIVPRLRGEAGTVNGRLGDVQADLDRWTADLGALSDERSAD